MIMLDKDLDKLAFGVKMGRITYGATSSLSPSRSSIMQAAGMTGPDPVGAAQATPSSTSKRAQAAALATPFPSSWAAPGCPSTRSRPSRCWRSTCCTTSPSWPSPGAPCSFLARAAAEPLQHTLRPLVLRRDHMDDSFVQSPKRWRVKTLGLYMMIIGPTSSIFDVTTFIISW